MSKRVYKFSEGNADMRNLLGGKGANLAEMTNIGLPIPNGFTISTRPARIITMMDKPSMKIRRSRSSRHLHGLRAFRARSSATLRTRFWFLFVPARAHPCPA